MRFPFVLLFGHVPLFMSAQAPVVEWLRTAGGFDQYTPYRSALDPTGGIYICGYGESDRDFGSGVIVADTGFTIARYDTAGTILWARPLTTSHPMEVYVHNVAVTSTGDLWMTGYFYSTTLTIDGFTLPNATSGSSMFVARFDNTGTALSASSWGGVGGLTRAQDISTDELDRVYVTGRTNADTLAFDGITLINDAGGYSMFVLSLDASGVPQWASMSEGTPGITEGLCVTADAAGNAYVATRFDQSITIGTATLSTGIDGHIALIKFAPPGVVEWMHAVAKCDPLDLAVDGTGNTYLSGDFQYDADFDGTLLIPSVLDGFVAAYDEDGAFRWVTPVQGAIDNELCWSVELDSAQTSLVVGGTFVLSAWFGDEFVETGIAPTDGFVMHMDTAGEVNWVMDMTGDGPTLFAEAHIDQAGLIHVSGTTQSMMSYLGEPVLNASGDQGFLTRFGELTTGTAPPPSVTSFAVIPNPGPGAFTVRAPMGTRMLLVDDASGRRVLEIPVNAAVEVPLHIEQPGLYFVNAITADGRSVRRIVVD